MQPRIVLIRSMYDIVCGVDHKGAEFISNKHICSLTDILDFIYLYG